MPQQYILPLYFMLRIKELMCSLQMGLYTRPVPVLIQENARVPSPAGENVYFPDLQRSLLCLSTNANATP